MPDLYRPKNLTLKNSRKKEILDLLSVNLPKKGYKDSLKFEIEDMSGQNISFCKLNGNFKAFFFSKSKEKKNFLDFLDNFKKEIPRSILIQENKRQHLSKIVKSNLSLLIDESDLINENFFFRSLNHRKIHQKKKSNFSFFKRKRGENFLENLKSEFFSLSSFSSSWKIFLFSTSLDFPQTNWGNIVNIKIFKNYNFFTIVPQLFSIKTKLKIIYLPCQGLFSRGFFFSFFLIGLKRSSRNHFISETLCNFFSNFVLYLYQPLKELVCLIIPRINYEKNKKIFYPLESFLKPKNFLNSMLGFYSKKNFIITRTYSWILICILSYIRHFLEKVFPILKKFTFGKDEKNSWKNFLFEKPINSRTSNLFYHFENFIGISKTRILIKKMLNRNNESIKKIFLSSVQKKRIDLLLKENFKNLLYGENDPIELVVNFENKKK